MKKIIDLIVKEPITTVQGFLYALVGLLSYYDVITSEEGGLWVIFLLAIFKFFSKDTSFKSFQQVSASVGGATGAVIKPRSK